MTELTDVELLAAFGDAEHRGVGWVKIQRLVRNAHGAFRVVRVDPALVVQLVDAESGLDRVRALILSTPCGYCGGGVGDPCRSAGGHRCSTFHVQRSRPVYDAWSLGHRDGLVDALRRLVKDWGTPAEELLRSLEVAWA